MRKKSYLLLPDSALRFFNPLVIGDEYIRILSYRLSIDRFSVLMHIRCRFFLSSNKIFSCLVKFRASIVIFIKPCIVCSSNSKRKDLRYMCVDCVAAVCIGECFKNFHTKLHFSSKQTVLIQKIKLKKYF